jgi:hypothetical protein
MGKEWSIPAILLTSVVRNPVCPSLVTSLVNLLAGLQAQSASVAEIWRFLEGCRAAEITHTHCHTDGVFSQQSIFVVSFSRPTSLNISMGGDRRSPRVALQTTDKS